MLLCGLNTKIEISAMNSYNRQNVLNLNYFINDEEGAELIQNNSYLMQGLN